MQWPRPAARWGWEEAGLAPGGGRGRLPKHLVDWPWPFCLPGDELGQDRGSPVRQCLCCCPWEGCSEFGGGSSAPEGGLEHRAALAPASRPPALSGGRSASGFAGKASAPGAGSRDKGVSFRDKPGGGSTWGGTLLFLPQPEEQEHRLGRPLRRKGRRQGGLGEDQAPGQEVARPLCAVSRGRRPACPTAAWEVGQPRLPGQQLSSAGRRRAGPAAGGWPRGCGQPEPWLLASLPGTPPPHQVGRLFTARSLPSKARES